MNPAAAGVLLTGATVGLVKYSDGTVAMSASGTVKIIGISGLSLTGMATVEVNNSLRTVDKTITIPGTTSGSVRVKFDTTNTVASFKATGAVLSVLGQTLTGDFGFGKVSSGDYAGSISVIASGVTLGLGDGTSNFVSVSGAGGAMLLTKSGLVADIVGTVTVSVPQVSAGGTFHVLANSTSAAVNDTTLGLLNMPAGPYLRISGQGAYLDIAGQRLSGNFTIEKTATASGGTAVRVGVTGLSLSLGDGTNTFVSVVNGQGMLLIDAHGLAASFSVNPSFNIPGVTLAGGTVTFEINTGTVAVDESMVVNGASVSIKVPAGPFTRLSAIGASLRIGGSGGPVLVGDFTFDKSTNGGVTMTRIAAANVSVTYDGQGLKDGEGGFIVTSTGIAGVLTGTIDIQGGGVQVGGRLGLRVNKTGHAVDETITLGTHAIAIKFDANEVDIFSFYGSGLSFNVGDFITIEGNISFTSLADRQVFAGTGLMVFMGQGPIKLPSGEISSTAVGVLISNATLGMVKFGDGTIAMTASGDVKIIGINGVSPCRQCLCPGE